jgi:hypothetical protein
MRESKQFQQPADVDMDAVNHLLLRDQADGELVAWAINPKSN